MKTRKVQQAGGSTFTISLPRAWAKKAELTPGVRVYVQSLPDGKLLISPENIKPLRKKTVDITNVNSGSLERTFVAIYLAGYNVIEFTSSKITADQKKRLRSICHRLIGPEIVEESSNLVLIQDMSGPNELPVKHAVQRMSLITFSMFNDSILSFCSCDSDLATDVMERDHEVYRLYMVISRQFKSILCGAKVIDSNASIEEYHNYRMAASSVERIANHSHRIARNVILLHPELDEKRIAEIKKMADFAAGSFKQAVESLLTLNPELANQVVENKKEMNQLITDFNRDYFDKSIDLSFEVMIGIRTVIDSIGRVVDYAACIGEIAMNASIDVPVEAPATDDASVDESGSKVNGRS